MNEKTVRLAIVDATATHLRLQFRGFGIDGQRPLLGELVCSEDEAFWLVHAIATATPAEAE